MAVLLLWIFPRNISKSNSRKHYLKSRIFMTWRNPGNLVSRYEFLGDSRNDDCAEKIRTNGIPTHLAPRKGKWKFWHRFPTRSRPGGFMRPHLWLSILHKVHNNPFFLRQVNMSWPTDIWFYWRQTRILQIVNGWKKIQQKKFFVWTQHFNRSCSRTPSVQ